MISNSFFDRDPALVAYDLIGKVLCRKIGDIWRYARIVETEAYYMYEHGSHASLGYTYKRRALYMPAGTVYMYYSRGGDSFNVSCRGEGNAVLIKAGTAEDVNAMEVLMAMRTENPVITKSGNEKPREISRLCAGQTIFCRSMRLKVSEHNAILFDKNSCYFKSDGYAPESVVCSVRHGIPKGRDEHLPLRYFDPAFVKSTTSGRYKTNMP